MKRMLKATAAVAVIIACITLAAGLSFAKKKKTYKFVMPVPEGLSMGSIPKLLQSTSDVIEKQTGLKIEVKERKYKSDDDVVFDILADLDKKKLDFAMVMAMDYTRYKNKHKDTLARPLFTVEMFKKTTYDVCMCTLKDSKISSPKKLKGKVWGGSHLTYTGYLLYKYKVKTDMDKFFKKMIYIPDENITNLMDALVDGKIDAFIMPDYQIDMSINTNKKYRAIKKSHCKEFEHNWIIVYRKGVSKTSAKKLKKVFLGAHKDRDFAQFQFLLKAIQGKFVSYDSKNMKTTKKVAKLVDKYGWREQEKKFYKKNH